MKAKIIKKKKRRKIRLEGFATLLFTFAILFYLGTKLGIKSYNVVLQQQAQSSSNKAKKLKTEVANLDVEVNTLKNRDRVLAIAEDDDIITRENNIVTIKKAK